MVTGVAGGLLERILSGPIGRQARAEAEREAHGQRLALLGELSALRAGHEKEAGEMAARKKAAEARLRETEAAYRAAGRAYQQVLSASMGASTGHDSRVAELERRLEGLAPAELAQFLTWCRDQADSLRSRWAPPRAVGGPSTWAEDKQRVEREAAENRQARDRFIAHIDAVTASGAWAKGLARQSLTDEEIRQQIGDRRAELERAGRAL